MNQPCPHTARRQIAAYEDPPYSWRVSVCEDCGQFCAAIRTVTNRQWHRVEFYIDDPRVLALAAKGLAQPTPH